MADADRCVFCGEIVPEGRQVCPRCESKNEERKYVASQRTNNKE